MNRELLVLFNFHETWKVEPLLAELGGGVGVVRVRARRIAYSEQRKKEEKKDYLTSIVVSLIIVLR